MDGWMDGRMDGRMDVTSLPVKYSKAAFLLKIIKINGTES